jgi:hypothetical protein
MDELLWLFKQGGHLQEIDIEVDHSDGRVLSDVATLWSLLEPLKDLSSLKTVKGLGAGAEAYGAESTKMETQHRKRKAETGVCVGSRTAKKKRFHGRQ